MSLAIFNINDAGVQIGLDGDLIRTSPGYAVLNNNELMVGEKAADNTKLLPRWTNSRFWSQLSTAPLAGGTSQIRHHADIAFAHLEDLWQPIANQASQAMFVVPGYYSAESLSLLLGIARECGVPVQGVADHSVLAASNLPLRRHVLHLDIHLHSMTLTALSNTGGPLVRRDANIILETGLATLWDRWANIIANQLIQTTRFDPMHNASSEQELFNQLPGWIAGLNDDSMHNFALNTTEAEHAVAISNENLLRACAPLYPQIVQAIRSGIPAGEQASLLLSHRFKGFPGLGDSLGLIPEIDVIELNESKSIGSANLHRGTILSDGGSVSHILQLDTGDATEESHADADSTAEGAGLPTHLLWQNRAYPIGAGFKLDADLTKGPRQSAQPVCSLYIRNGQLILEADGAQGLTLNGNAAEETSHLSAGDVLGVGETQLTLITVLSDG